MRKRDDNRRNSRESSAECRERRRGQYTNDKEESAQHKNEWRKVIRPLSAGREQRARCSGHSGIVTVIGTGYGEAAAAESAAGVGAAATVASAASAEAATSAASLMLQCLGSALQAHCLRVGRSGRHAKYVAPAHEQKGSALRHMIRG